MKKGTLDFVAHVDWLKNRGANIYTQFGEDGLINGCLERIGRTCRHCFEIGAADGRFFSNTLALREQGWFAVLIEQDKSEYQALHNSYGQESVCIHKRADDLDEVLGETNIDSRPDLGVIDVDGQDWHLWNRMRKYRPRIMLVEIFPLDRNTAEPVPKRGAIAGQAGLDAIHLLGIRKGYELVATTFCNALFVDRKELKALEGAS